MTASEPSPLASNLQESIEHLIAETVRRSQVDHEQEKEQLRTALQQALTEIESGQAAMNRAADLLRTALDTPESEDIKQTPTPNSEEQITASTDTSVVIPAAAEIIAVQEESASAPITGQRDLDVVAHSINFRVAGNLQKWLNDRAEVANVKTRTYVDNELHLELKLESGLDMTAMKTWLTEHDGSIATNTDSVLELRFGS